MPLQPITHPLLDRAGVRHGFFTREGGVSTGIYEGLNTGVGSRDDPAAIAENRRRIAHHLGGDSDDLAACFQIHSAVAHVAEEGWKGARPEGDATVTAIPGVICAVLTADCAPILLADTEAGKVDTVVMAGGVFPIVGPHLVNGAGSDGPGTGGASDNLSVKISGEAVGDWRDGFGKVALEDRHAEHQCAAGHKADY